MAELFDGYIPSKCKIPLYSLNEKSPLDKPPLVGDYVGVLKNGIVQVDIDEMEFAQIVLKIVQDYKLKCDVLQTSRGLHFYFKSNDRIKKQKVHWYNAIGIPTDYGIGDRNRVVPLKVTETIEQTKILNGQEVKTYSELTTIRQWLQQYDELDEIPCWLLPISKNDTKITSITARNQSLFNYILTLQSNNMNKDEIRLIIKIINSYILEEPLADKEIDTITRDEAFSEEIFFERGHFLHDRFGNYLINNSNIIRVDGQVNIYTDEKLYSNNPDDFEKEMLKKIPSLKDSQRKEVYKYIHLQCKKTGEFANPKLIGLKDNIFDLEHMATIPYSPSVIMPNKIPYNYNPRAYNELMDKTLNKVACNDREIRLLLEEMFGYCLYRKNSLQVCFILTGEGSNGKSTILNLLKKLIGKNNFSSLDPKEFDSTYKPAELYGKLANFGDDISARYIENSSIFKKIVTGESFMVERKYMQPFELENYATQIFCANEMPRVNDTTDGFFRRLVLVPFNAKFSKTDDDYDPFIEDKLMTDEAMEYLLKLAIDGLKRVIINKKFQTSSKGEAEKNEYVKINNPIEEWLDENPKILNESVNDVYLAYKTWCASVGCSAMKKLNVSRAIKRRYNYDTKITSINGKSVRIYKQNEEED